MQKDLPDHHDAELVLKVYDLRREDVMRDSRRKVAEFLPRTFGDVQAIVKNDHPLNAAYRQVSTYWEMVYGLARHGIVHADYLLENNGEGLILFAKIAPWLERYRQEISPRAFRNAEWAATQCEMGKTIFASFRARVEKQLAAK